MRNTIKVLVLSVILCLTHFQKVQSQEFNWNFVIDAIAQVESGGNPKAHNPRGDCAGLLQIRSILVRECNNILQARGEKKRYTLQDRYDPEKSKEMFVLIQSKYNKENDIEKAIRLWNGGIGNLKYPHKTQVYLKKVQEKFPSES